MSANHTRGPWHSAMKSAKTWNRGIYTESGFEVATVKVASALSASVRDGDAALMAASPELYKELAHLVALIEPCINDGRVSIPGLATLNAANAALAKARGEA